MGTTGPAGAVDDFTALGDVVNTTARLASAAAAGEILVTVAATDAAAYEVSGLERRNLEVRGRHEPIDVVVIRPSRCFQAEAERGTASGFLTEARMARWPGAGAASRRAISRSELSR